jgi:type II secretory pathway pseudopilin PulG
MRTKLRAPAAGFSLVELALVFAIVALLMASLMFTLSAQVETRNFEDTRRRLEQARELVLGFAIVNGRLPCPATAASSGDESQTPAGSGICTPAPGVTGWLPARSIGFQQTDSSGYAIDTWGNRIRYAVSTATPLSSATAPVVCRPGGAAPTAPHFTHKDNLRANGIDCRPNDLLVCKLATGVSATDCGGGANQITAQNLVVAIIFSTGKNGALAPCATCVDELANLDGNATFVWHVPASSTAPTGEFDDQFSWITVGELYGKLIAAGQLP